MWTVLFARLAWVHFKLGSAHEILGWRAGHLCRKNKRSTGEEEAKLESFLNGGLYPDCQQKSQEVKHVRERLSAAAVARGSQDYQPMAVLTSGNHPAFPFIPLPSTAQWGKGRKRSWKDKKTIHKQLQVLFSGVQHAIIGSNWRENIPPTITFGDFQNLFPNSWVH